LHLALGTWHLALGTWEHVSHSYFSIARFWQDVKHPKGVLLPDHLLFRALRGQVVRQ